MSCNECIQVGAVIDVIVGGLFKGRVERFESHGRPRVTIECAVAKDEATEYWLETNSYPNFDGVEVLKDEDLMKRSEGPAPPLPKVGDEVRVDIGPNPVFGATYEQIGRVLAAWTTPGGRQRIIVEVTGSLSDEENVENYFSDDAWIGSIFLAVAPGTSECCLRGGCDGQWVARVPVSDRARELWADEGLAMGDGRCGADWENSPLAPSE